LWHRLLKKSVPSAVGFPHCAGSREGLFLSPKPYPHKCAEAGARTRDLPVTDGRLYRCTRPALPSCALQYSTILPSTKKGQQVLGCESLVEEKNIYAFS